MQKYFGQYSTLFGEAYAGIFNGRIANFFFCDKSTITLIAYARPGGNFQHDAYTQLVSKRHFSKNKQNGGRTSPLQRPLGKELKVPEVFLLVAETLSCWCNNCIS